MPLIIPINIKKLSLNQKYKQYLNDSPKSIMKLSNTNNLFDDLNSTDKQMIKDSKIFMQDKKSGASLLQ
ncbi:hypothetical protein BH23PAT1_BH23PAT1_3880 [soil metagenome]